MAGLLGSAHGGRASLRALLPSLLGFDEFADFIGLPEVRELEQRFAEG